ncbi:MAG: hypothetical protein RLZZ385_2415 [Pseudomonadota bacterium]|jgi:putative exporter of polyketide antibiotics
MNEVWGNPANWTQEQWLAVCLLLFIMVAIVFLTYRLYVLMRTVGKSTYKPNLRRLRQSRHAGLHKHDDQSDT